MGVYLCDSRPDKSAVYICMYFNIELSASLLCSPTVMHFKIIEYLANVDTAL